MFYNRYFFFLIKKINTIISPISLYYDKIHLDIPPYVLSNSSPPPQFALSPALVFFFIMIMLINLLQLEGLVVTREDVINPKAAGAHVPGRLFKIRDSTSNKNFNVFVLFYTGKIIVVNTYIVIVIVKVIYS